MAKFKLESLVLLLLSSTIVTTANEFDQNYMSIAKKALHTCVVGIECEVFLQTLYSNQSMVTTQLFCIYIKSYFYSPMIM